MALNIPPKIIPRDQDEVVITTALGSVQNSSGLGRGGVGRWVSEVRQAMQNLAELDEIEKHRPNDAIDAAGLIDELLGPQAGVDDQLMEMSFEASDIVVEKFIEVLNNPELADTIFSESGAPDFDARRTQILEKMRRFHPSPDPDAELFTYISLDGEALAKLLVRCERGEKISIEEYSDIATGVYLQHGHRELKVKFRLSLDPEDRLSLPGFANHGVDARVKIESFGDQYVGRQLSPLSGRPDSRATLAVNLIPPILRPPQLGALPGRSSLTSHASLGAIHRSSKPGDPMFVPQSPEDWLVLIPVVPSFAPGVIRAGAPLIPQAAQVLTKGFRVLIQAPTSLLLMISGPDALIQPKDPSRADGVI